MGVSGLLPQLKSIQEAVSLHKYAGQTLAIDGYSWLHKAVITCTKDLFYSKPTDAYVTYFMRKIDMLRHHQIEPYFVFDGDNFGSKKDIEVERQEQRRQSRLKALEAERRGDTASAFKYYFPAIDVTPQMAKSVIEYLQSQQIKFVVAPYEADSQLVFLEKLGLVHGVLSEDSDLLVFGCETLITKLDKYGYAIEIKREKFIDNPRSPLGHVNDLQLRALALISGCDYTNGIRGIGPVTAIKKIRNISSIDKLFLSLELDGYRVETELAHEIRKADLSFRFQRVFNPITNKMDTLNEIPENCNTELLHECIGDLYPEEIHQAIAYGELHPTTKLKLYSREFLLANGVAGLNQATPELRPLLFSPLLNITKQASEPRIPIKISTSPVTNMINATNHIPLQTPYKIKPGLKRISPKFTLNRIDNFFGSSKSTTSTQSTLERKRGLTEPAFTPTKRINVQLPTPLSSAEDLSGEFNYLVPAQPLSPTSRRVKRLLSQPESKPITSKFFSHPMQKTDTDPDCKEENLDYCDSSIATGSEADIEDLKLTSTSDPCDESNVELNTQLQPVTEILASENRILKDLDSGNILDEMNENTLDNIDLLNDFNEKTKMKTNIFNAFDEGLTSSDLELSDIDKDIYEDDEQASKEAEKISTFHKGLLQTFRFNDKVLSDLKKASEIKTANTVAPTISNPATTTSISTNNLERSTSVKQLSIRRKPLNTIYGSHNTSNILPSSTIALKKSDSLSFLNNNGSIENTGEMIKISSLTESFAYKPHNK